MQKLKAFAHGALVPVLLLILWEAGSRFGLFSEVQRAAAAAVDGVRGAWNGYVDLRGVQAENLALKAEVDALRVRLQATTAWACDRSGGKVHALNLSTGAITGAVTLGGSPRALAIK